MEQFNNVHSYAYPEIKFTKTKVRMPFNIRDGKEFEIQRLEENIEKQKEERRNQELELLMLLDLSADELNERMVQFEVELEHEMQDVILQMEAQKEEILNSDKQSYLYDEIVYDLPDYMKMQDEIVTNVNMAVDATMIGLDEMLFMQEEANMTASEAIDATMIGLDEVISVYGDVIFELESQLMEAHAQIAQLQNNMAMLADKVESLINNQPEEGENE